MSFDATYQGKVYKNTSTESYIYDFQDGVFKGSIAAELDGKLVVHKVALTGYSVTSNRGKQGFQTTDGHYIILSEGWEYIGQIPVLKYGQSQAQALVNGIIRNNIQIVQNNLVCARYASKFTEDQQDLIRALQRRATGRSKALSDQGLCSNVKTSYPKGYADLGGYLTALMEGEAIGIATWAVVVIVASVIAATATAAYYAYKILFDESEKDIKYSKQLMAVLQQKLTPAEYEQLKKETQGIVTKSKIRAAAVGAGSALTIAAWVLAGFALYKFIKNR